MKKLPKKTFFIILLAGSILILIFFIFITMNQSQNNSGFIEEGCVVGGCSGEICQGENEEPIFTPCIYKGDFDCYKTARCEVQGGGKCGWTMDVKLKSCLILN